MRLLPIIVTYYPEKERLLQTVGSLIDHVDKVLIWENTPISESKIFRHLTDSRVEYLSNGVNSISKALNQAWHYAVQEGYDALLTMDQDSYFDDFGGYVNWASAYVDALHPAVCSPWYYSKMDTPKVFHPEHVITSGMILPLSILNEVGGYYERFDVEAVDIDFCLRVKAHGFDILQNSMYTLNHIFGQTYTKVVMGHLFSGPGYGASRLRYIFRNYIIAYRRNGKPDFLKKQVHWFLANYIPNIIFCEKNKLGKIVSIIIGSIEGMTANNL